MSAYREQGLVFKCGDNRLVGITAIPKKAADIGVLILVGGPQYRVGSHRQFTLLARSLAEAGFPSLRFDYTGMGDSEGGRTGFCHADSDIRAAIDSFYDTVPGLSKVVLWGLCDGASSAMMFASNHDRVAGMVLLNPWVHAGEYSPQVKLSHYYRPLLTERDYWRRLLAGKVELLPAFKGLARATFSSLSGYSGNRVKRLRRQSYVQDMLEGLQKFSHDVLFVLSENDLTAREFSTLLESEKPWKAVMKSREITIKTVLGADHTFSHRPLQDEASKITIAWLQQL